MELLYPIGLLAAAGLLIPLLIHLWKVNQGSVLKIGSIALLGVSSRKSSKSLKLTDWLLFLLRCLLILLLAFLIAKPVVENKMNGGDQNGWVLMDKADLPLVYKENRFTIDSLLKAGYELRDFSMGFEQLSLKDTLTETPDLPNVHLHTALLKQLNGTLPKDYKVYLYSDRRMNQLSDVLPKVSYDLQHRFIHRSDTLSSWTITSYGKTFEAQSSPLATYYKTLAADTGSINILVHESGYAEDKVFINAAIDAIAGFSERNVLVKPWNKANFEQLQPDLVFWLADSPVDPILKSAWKKGATVFSYAQGKTKQLQSFIIFDNESMAVGGEAINLNKRIQAPEHITKAHSLWTDGFGDPLLSLQHTKGLNEYLFYTRFDPQWTDFVWNEQFVKRLMPLVFGDTSKEVDFGFESHDADQRILPSSQKLALPVKQSATADQVDLKQPLSPLIWLMAWLVFVLERILSIRNKNKSAV
ncbi:BatA domain-containing protein [Pedobacter sp.]|uniref:BatA domain-containing protein n=1 Tax=Pedobacter sp. TaxID=1411316 RepID=UPI003D7FD54D